MKKASYARKGEKIMSSITWSPIMAFAMLALAFTIGDYVSS